MWNAQHALCSHLQRGATQRESGYKKKECLAHFDQPRHGVLKAQAFSFKFLRCGSRPYSMHAAENHTHFCKRTRQNETVPTVHSPAAGKFHIDRHDCCTGFLREKNNARPELIGWSAWTVWRDQNIVAGREHILKLPQRAGTRRELEPRTTSKPKRRVKSLIKSPSRLALISPAPGRCGRNFFKTNEIKSNRLCQSAAT